MKKKNLVRTIIILFCLAFLMVGMVSNASTLSDLTGDKSAVDKEKAEIQAQLKEQQETLEKNQGEMASLIKEQEALTSERDAMLLDIQEIFESIEALDETIKSTEEEYNKKLSLLKERALLMYQSSGYSMLQIFIEADSLLDFLNRQSYYNAMLEKDQKLIDEVVALKADLAAKRAMQVENKASYEKLVAEKNTVISQLDEKKGDLSQLSESTKEMIENLEAMEAKMAQESEDLGEKIRLEQERIRKQKEAEEAAKRKPKNTPTPKPTPTPTPAPTKDTTSSTDNEGDKDTNVTPSPKPTEAPKEDSGKKFLWPSNHKYAYVSSYFGMRMHPIYNYMRMHNGIDITGWNINGTDILAAESGTVLISEWQTGGGYGQYVVIDHGDGISTVYAHASKLIAKAGQHVERGDVIALVGTTGNSTGPHIHFEVRVDGTPVNPLDYV